MVRQQRIEIKNKIQDNLEESKKQGKTLEKIVDDNNTISRFSKEFKGSATFEGLQAINKSVEKARKATIDNFKTEGIRLEKIMQKSRQIEQDLLARSRFAHDDAKKAKDTSIRMHQTDDAKRYLVDAAVSSMEDSYFTDEQRRKAQEDREKSRQKLDYLTSIIQNTVIYLPQLEKNGAAERGGLNSYGMDVSRNPYQDQIDKMERKDRAKQIWHDRKEQMELIEQRRMQEKLDKTKLDVRPNEKPTPGYIKNNPGYNLDKEK